MEVHTVAADTSIKVRVYDVDWDTDGEAIELPDVVIIELRGVSSDRGEEFEERVCNAASDAIGWCINGFLYKVL